MYWHCQGMFLAFRLHVEMWGLRQTRQCLLLDDALGCQWCYFKSLIDLKGVFLNAAKLFVTFCKPAMAWRVQPLRLMAFCLTFIHIIRVTLNTDYRVWHPATILLSRSCHWMDHLEWGLTWKMVYQSVLYSPFKVSKLDFLAKNLYLKKDFRP